MQICLIRRLVNRESGRFEASEGVNIPDLYTVLHVQNSLYAVAKAVLILEVIIKVSSACKRGLDRIFLETVTLTRCVVHYGAGQPSGSAAQ